MAPRTDWIVRATDDLLSALERGDIGYVLGKRCSGHRHAVAMQQSVFQEHPDDGWRSTDGVEVFHQVRTARSEIRKERYPAADFLKIIDREIDPERSCNGQKMEDSVRRSTQNDHQRNGILKGLARQNIPRPQVLF